MTSFSFALYYSTLGAVNVPTLVLVEKQSMKEKSYLYFFIKTIRVIAADCDASSEKEAL